MGVMAMVTFMAYRRIAAAGRLMVVLWVGMLVTVAWVIATGLTHFDAARWRSTSRRAPGTPIAASPRSWAWRWRSRCTTSSAITRSATWATKWPTRPERSPARSSSR